jgi:hypothetical protein
LHDAPHALDVPGVLFANLAKNLQAQCIEFGLEANEVIGIESCLGDHGEVL